MKLLIKAGTTSQRARVFLQDSSSSTGAGLTGLLFSTSNLKWSYIREDQATAQAVTLVTATINTWASGGFKEVDSALLPGVYEIGIPNAALASGKSVQMLIFGATNLAPTPLEIELIAVDVQDSAALGMTNLDATVSSAVSAANSINSNSALIRISVPGQLPIPATSTTVYEFDLLLYDVEGHNVNADGASNGIGSITFHVKNSAGTSLDAQLGAVTFVSTGLYKISYTVNSTDTAQELIVTASAVVGAQTRTIVAPTLTAPFFATTFTSTDRTALNGIVTTLGTPAGASLSRTSRR